jgi:hypothetical protein
MVPVLWKATPLNSVVVPAPLFLNSPALLTAFTTAVWP